jgi:hypothetical protein
MTRTRVRDVTSTQATLGLKTPSQVRSIFYEGSSSFGNGYHYLDINDSAAILSRAAGAPVRLQLMRWDEQGWNKYGPAIMHDMRAASTRGQHRRVRGRRVRAGRCGRQRRQAAARQRPAAPGAGRTNAENLGPMYKVAQRSGTRATA